MTSEIRAFHITGKGLNACLPVKPLRPESLPLTNPVLPDPGLLLDLYTKALCARRGPARKKFLTDLRICRDRLRDLLALDDSRQMAYATSPAVLSAAFGKTSSFFDSGALATVLEAMPAPAAAPMPAARRRRCEAAVAALTQALTEAAEEPLYWELPVSDPGASAYCEAELDGLVTALKALRVARLELDSAYDPAIHDMALARFTWESADADELAAMPVVVVMDSANKVAENSLTSFGQFLRSGLPIHVLITCPRFYTGDLAFLAVAHREAFVLQSSAACASHLAEGLMNMAATLRPAVAIVSTEDTAAFAESGVFPMYEYDPRRGEHWSERFLLHAPALAGTAVNAVHVAALSEQTLHHFRVIPQTLWSDEQVELAAYEAQSHRERTHSIPYIWVLDEAGEQHRAIVTRELVLIARDRQNAFRMLRELSEAGRPKTPPVDVEKIKQEAAHDTIQRALALLNGGKVPVLPAPVRPSGPTVAPQAPAPEPAAGPYVESDLCTSCNDCTKINSRLFLYNANRQVYVGDPAAGTFAQLVKAAEGCPARCIHPGAPRAGDPSATPQLLARAAKFN